MKKLPLSKSASGTLAGLVAASSAQGIIHITTPVSVSAAGSGSFDSASWDIDNDTFAEATLGASASIITGFESLGRAYINSLINDLQFAIKTSVSAYKLSSITAGAVVDSDNSFHNGTINFSNVTSNLAAANFEFLSQPNATIGFRFNIGAGLHFGVASITWGTSGVNGVSLTINEWWYNEVPEAGITGAGTAVPEPATVATGLGALALGAASLRRRRKTRK